MGSEGGFSYLTAKWLKLYIKMHNEGQTIPNQI